MKEKTQSAVPHVDTTCLVGGPRSGVLRLGEVAVGISGSSPVAASGPPGISPSSTDSAGDGERGSSTEGDRRGRGVMDLHPSSSINTSTKVDTTGT